MTEILVKKTHFSFGEIGKYWQEGKNINKHIFEINSFPLAFIVYINVYCICYQQRKAL